MREARIIFLIADGTSIPSQRAIDKINFAFGGCTIVQGHGSWRAPNGEYQQEVVKIVDIAYEQNTASDAKLYDLAWAFCQDAKQVEVYLRYGNGHVQMVRELGCMDNGASWNWEDFRVALHKAPDDPNDIPEEHKPGELPNGWAAYADE
jgi:hypothetical protein